MYRSKKWLEIVRKYYVAQASYNATEIFFSPPCVDGEIKKWECDQNIKLNDEFIDLYKTCNGFGVFNNKIKEYMLIPLDSLSAFIKESRSTFQQTHPEIALRFYPFIDWGNGDVSGFLYSTNCSLLKNIYTFEHESYEHDSDQKWGEFISTGEKCIEDVFAADFSLVKEYLERKEISDAYTPSSVAEWENWIRKYCETELDEEKFQIVKGEQIDEANLSLLEKELNVTLPSDFHSFYRNFNGFGAKLSSSETIWFMPALANIQTFITEYRSRIDKRNKLISDYFIPIIDLDHDGLYGGYVVDQTGKIAEGLYMTDMDDYEQRKAHNLPCEPCKCWDNIAHMLR